LYTLSLHDALPICRRFHLRCCRKTIGRKPHNKHSDVVVPEPGDPTRTTCSRYHLKALLESLGRVRADVDAKRAGLDDPLHVETVEPEVAHRDAQIDRAGLAWLQCDTLERFQLAHRT